MQQKTLIEIGQVVRPRGLKGEVKVLAYSDSPDRFLELEYVYLRDHAGLRKLKIQSAGNDGVHAFVRLDGIDTQQRARELVGRELFIEDSQMRPLDEGEFYQRDLLGCRVEDPTGKRIGKVSDLMEVPQGLLLVIDPGEGLIPFQPEFVTRVDPGQKLIQVDLPPGLIGDTGLQ